MAEVFATISAALGALDVSARSIQQLQQVVKTWSHAPIELLALQNEVGDLRYLLDEIRRTAATIEASVRNDARFAAALREQLRKAEDLFQSLNGILDEMSKLKKHKKKFNWVRREGRVEGLKSAFRQVREHIINLLVTHQVTKTTRLELEILSVQTVGRQQHQDITGTLDRLHRRMDTTYNILTSSHNDLLSCLSPIPGIEEKTREVLSLMSSNRVTEEAFRTEVVETIQNLSSQINPKLDALVSPQPLGQPEAIHGVTPVHQLQYSQYNTITILTRRRGICFPSCICSCHLIGDSTHRWSLPQGLSRLLGSLFVRYTGWPVSLLCCDSNTCLATQASRVEVNYVFPTWMMWYNICLLVEKSVGRKPSIGIALKNRVRWSSSELFLAAHTGDIGRVTSILKAVPCCLNDVRDKDGTIPLYWAARNGHVEVVRLLLQAGADPDQQNDSGQTVRIQTIRNALMKGDISSDMSQLFGVHQCLQDEDISDLTKAVLQLPGHHRIEDLIKASTSRSIAEAKRVDVFGYTALHWACISGNAEAVRMLLQLGLNVDARNPYSGERPLHCIGRAQKGGRACVALLCQAGAKFMGDEDSLPPLHQACSTGTAETVSELVCNGASLEERIARSGNSVLHVATEKDNVTVLDWLLDHGGVDIEATSVRGNTALCAAIGYNSLKCASSLLRRRASHLWWVDGEVRTILHDAAECSNIQALRLLSNHDLRDVEIQARYKGQTAQDTFNVRAGKSDGLIVAFGELLKAIEQAKLRIPHPGQGLWDEVTGHEGGAGTDHVDQEEIFFDAVESQNTPVGA